MALLLMQGFDEYVDSTDLGQDQYWGCDNTANISFVSGRYDGNAMQVTTTRNIWGSFPTSNSTVYIGFAVQTNILPSSDRDLLDLRDEIGTLQTRIVFNAAGTLSIERGGTVTLGTSTGTLSAGSWNYVVLKVLYHDSAGTLELWINGTKELDLTSQDTLQGSLASASIVDLLGMSGVTVLFDDIYIGDTSGSDMTDQVGEVHIELLTPDANGTTNNFTASPAVSNYLNVDEAAGSSDGDTTYNYSATATDKELYGFSAITNTVDTIHAVQVKARVRKEDAGNRTVNLIARSSATEVDSGQKGMSDTYTWLSHLYENDPNGGGNWSESAVNAAEFGLEIGA